MRQLARLRLNESFGRRGRAESIRVPVIVLTARDRIDDRVAGLDAGADDYVVKPFAFAELLARMRSLSRRGHPVESGVTTVGSLTIDIIARRVRCAGTPVELTSKGIRSAGIPGQT